MSADVRQLTYEALRLPPEDRLALGAALIDSVEGTTASTWEQAWLAELDARKARGISDARPWAEVRDRILRRLTNG